MELVRRTLSAPRLAHCLGVRDEIVRLADRFGIGGDRAGLARAGLLHDLGRERPPDEMRALAATLGDRVPAELAAAPILLHGAAAVALMARGALPPLPPALERAVILHPSGDPSLAPPSLLLMLADLTEATRDYPSAARMRAALDAAPDLVSAARVILAAKFGHHRTLGYVDGPLAGAMLAALGQGR